MMPDFFETEVIPYGCFVFKLPAAALWIESDIILEISVQYGFSADGTHLHASAWAREEHSSIKGFIHAVSAPWVNDEYQSVFRALTEDEGFIQALREYVEMLECRQ